MGVELPETCDSIESPVSLAEHQHLWFVQLSVTGLGILLLALSQGM